MSKVHQNEVGDSTKVGYPTFGLSLCGFVSIIAGGPFVFSIGVLVLAILLLIQKRYVSVLLALSSIAMYCLFADLSIHFAKGIVSPLLSAPLLLLAVVLNSEEVSRVRNGVLSTAGLALVLAVLSATSYRYTL